MDNISDFVDQLQVAAYLRASLLLVIGYFISRFVSTSINGSLKKRLSLHQVTLLRRIVFYTIFLLFFASAIQQLGFRINALLGATGILTVAIGIAAQTSMSNVISGIFIIGEKPFEIGNTIKVNGHQGEVIAIDFLSVKIRTTDNLMIRIPNETLIKSAITNVSYFPLRRIDLKLLISYQEDIANISALLLETAKNEALYLKDPAPAVTVDSLNDYGVNLLFTVWVKQGNHSKAKDQLQTAIQAALKRHDIDITSRTPLADLKGPITVKLIGTENPE